MTCPACGTATEAMRLPLDRSVLARCPGCGHAVTAKAPPHRDETAYAVRDEDRRVFERRYLPARRRSYARGLDLLEPAGGRLLDFGSNYGDFLVLAIERGWDPTGYEPGAMLRERALASVRDRLVGTLEEAEASGPYEVVTLWDVLEHLDDAPAQLKRLAGLLAAQGRLLVRVPDARALEREALGRIGPFDHLYLKLCHPVNPEEHFSHFTPLSLARLAAGAGLREERVIEAKADERVAAGRGAADTALRGALHRRRRRLPYEFTAVFRRVAP